MKKAIHLFLFFTIGIALSTITAPAQDFRATITGRVTDASKAAIANAQVQVKNTGTNEVATTTTDSEGNYKVPLLRPGYYSVTVEASGFKKAVRDAVELVISQVATLDFSLETGSINEQITVQGDAPLIESATADRGGVIDRQRVVELPLNARNPFMLGVLTPGVNFNGASIWQRPFDNGAIAEWTINGSQSRGNEFLLDGAPNNAQAGDNNIAYVPPVDSVQDFKIMTNTYDAQYGKTTGGIINVNLKSGTNNLHGSIYEFMRRAWLDASDFRLKANDQPKAAHYLDQYGFMLEGPVYIPKVYNGRDKTFFMVNYEGYREGVPQPLALSVPTPEMLNGDFSRLVDAAGRQIVLYDPATGHRNDAVPGGWERFPFRCDAAGNPIGGSNDSTLPLCNKIPADRINPIAQNILRHNLQPNRTDPTQGYSRSNLLVSPNLAVDDFYNLAIKVDRQFNEKNRMYVRYARNDRTEIRNTNGLFDVPGQDGQHPLKRINDAFVVDHLATFSPNFIFNIRASFGRFVEGSRGDADYNFDLTSLGFPQDLVSQLPQDPRFGRYEFYSSGDTQEYNTLGRYSDFNYSNTVALHPSFTWVRGSQTWRSGVDMRWVQYNRKNEGNPFRLRATRNFTQQQYNVADSNSGNSIATFLLGYVSEGGVDYNVFPTTLGKYYAPWFQNDWKVNQRLTLNLGVRWDINKPPNERYNQLNRGFDPNVINPVDSLVDHTLLPNGQQLRGGLLFAGVDGNSRIPGNIDWNNIQPRIGFAYRLKEKLVMRGGWGLYYVNPNNNYLQYNGFSATTPIVGSLDGGRTPVNNLLSNPFPNGVIVPSGSSLGLETFLGRDNTNTDALGRENADADIGNPNFAVFNPNFKIPYVHQFSVGFQYQLPWEAMMEFSYVGNRTKNLQTSRQLNEPSLALRQQCNPLEGGNAAFCNEQLPNPFQGLEPFRGTALFDSPRLSRWDLSRPYPQFGRIVEVGRNDGSISYDSFQMKFEKRARGGMSLMASYTFSKQIESWGWNDVQQDIMQRGLYLWDRPHRFTAGMVYQLPFGEGKRLFGSKRGVLGKLVSGWESNLIFQWQSGRPWNMPEDLLYMNEDAVLKDIQWKGTEQVWAFRTYPRVNNPNIRAVCAGQINGDGSMSLMPYSEGLNGCGPQNVDFIRAPQYASAYGTTYNSVRYTSFRHPSLRLHSPPIADLSFSKTTKFNERLRMQFRVEMFNFTNTFSYRGSQFTNNINDINFGSIIPRNAEDTDVAYPRHIQLALKFIF